MEYARFKMRLPIELNARLLEDIKINNKVYQIVLEKNVLKLTNQSLDLGLTLTNYRILAP